MRLSRHLILVVERPVHPLVDVRYDLQPLLEYPPLEGVPALEPELVGGAADLKCFVTRTDFVQGPTAALTKSLNQRK